MTGWNLPPGCTQADIDRALEGDSCCQKCGKQTDELEREIVRGRVRWLCGDCSAAWERHCEAKMEEAREEK